MFFLRRIYIVFLAFFPSYQYAMQENNNIVNKNNNKTIKKLTKKNNTKKPNIAKQVSFFGKVNRYMNKNKLSYLWMFLDNVPFQYGGSKILKHGEAYYGLSNGIGFFPSFLNFGWLKIGIVDAHINVINLILVGFKHLIKQKSGREDYYSVEANILYPLYYNSVITGIHLLSFNLLNCLKVKIISIGAIILKKMGKIITGDDIGCYHWYHSCSYSCYSLNNYGLLSSSYLLLSPRIEINISGIVKYFNGK